MCLSKACTLSLPRAENRAILALCERSREFTRLSLWQPLQCGGENPCLSQKRNWHPVWCQTPTLMVSEGRGIQSNLVDKGSGVCLAVASTHERIIAWRTNKTFLISKEPGH